MLSSFDHDCLVKVFLYLEVSDLLNLLETCEYLKFKLQDTDLIWTKNWFWNHNNISIPHDYTHFITIHKNVMMALKMSYKVWNRSLNLIEFVEYFENFNNVEMLPYQTEFFSHLYYRSQINTIELVKREESDKWLTTFNKKDILNKLGQNNVFSKIIRYIYFKVKSLYLEHFQKILRNITLF